MTLQLYILTHLEGPIFKYNRYLGTRYRLTNHIAKTNRYLRLSVISVSCISMSQAYCVLCRSATMPSWPCWPHRRTLQWIIKSHLTQWWVCLIMSINLLPDPLLLQKRVRFCVGPSAKWVPITSQVSNVLVYMWQEHDIFNINQCQYHILLTGSDLLKVTNDSQQLIRDQCHNTCNIANNNDFL